MVSDRVGSKTTVSQNNKHEGFERCFSVSAKTGSHTNELPHNQTMVKADSKMHMAAVVVPVKVSLIGEYLL